MAGVGAVEAEAAHRVLEGQREQGTLVEPRRGSRTGERPGGAGEQGEVGKADPACLESGDARGERLRLLAGGDRTGRGVAGHRALMADPVDR
jgi:hypothetical protein